MPNAGLRDRIAKPRLLAAEPRDESFERALEIADANFHEMNTRSLHDWVRLSKGLAEYRRGEAENLKAAVKHLDTSFEGFKNSRSFQQGAGITRFIAAMAHHKLGNSELAEATYLEGLDRHDHLGSTLRQSTTAVGNDWQQAEVARREAAELLKIDETRIDPPITDTADWTVLFEDNFDVGISDDWQQMTGDWLVVDGAACGTLKEGYGRLEREIVDLPNTFEIKYETWTSDALLAACFMRLPSEERTPPIGHRVALTSVPDRLFVAQGKPGNGVSLVTNESFNAWANQSVPDFEVQPEQHYKVRIIRQPQRITVFVDGKQVVSERVRNINTRSIRFFARGEEGTKMFVDNIRIGIPNSGAAQPGE